jgi:hypothetical protein
MGIVIGKLLLAGATDVAAQTHCWQNAHCDTHHWVEQAVTRVNHKAT